MPKTVLVTGAAKRLGRAIALDLAADGWNVAIHYHGSADEAENLINIYAALADQDRDAVIAQFAGQQFSGFKNALADLTVAKLESMAKEMRRLLADPAEIDRILKSGAHKARAIATPVMDEVKRRVGFIS